MMSDYSFCLLVLSFEQISMHMKRFDRCRIRTKQSCCQSGDVPSDSDNGDVPTTSLDASVMLLGYVPVFTC